MKIILIGIQGSGKSTQGKLLSKKLKLPYLATGQIFRETSKQKTRWGRYVKRMINKGLLIPDSKAVPIVEEYLRKPEYQKGYILDGFPRTVGQAKAFNDKIDIVYYIEVSDKEAVWRLVYRTEQKREDETTTAIRKRIELFHSLTEPLIAYYRQQGILVVVNGEQTVEAVHRDVMRAIKVRV